MGIMDRHLNEYVAVIRSGDKIYTMTHRNSNVSRALEMIGKEGVFRVNESLKLIGIHDVKNDKFYPAT